MRKKDCIKKKMLSLMLGAVLTFSSIDPCIAMAKADEDVPVPAEQIQELEVPEDATKDVEIETVIPKEETKENISETESNLEFPKAGNVDVIENDEFIEETGILNEEQPEGTNIQVVYRTQDEIRDFLKESGAPTSATATYAEEPVVTAPYSLGVLSEDTLQSAVAMLNQVRYIAGLPAEVKLNDGYNVLAQAASLVDYANGELSHTPSRPADMEEDLYNIGYMGAGQSNLARGSGDLNSTIIHAWMADFDKSNADRVGHRRWILNPYMGETGFGLVSGEKGSYSAVYAFDNSDRSVGNVFGVAWPAQNMPVNYFTHDYPWSVSLGEAVYASQIQVLLTRINDGKTWHFSQEQGEDGYFYVNNDRYGQTGCIIFGPKTPFSYKAGDSFKVEITKEGEPYVSYTVNFFKLSDDDPDYFGKRTLGIDGITVEDKIYDGKAFSYTGTPTAVNEIKKEVEINLIPQYEGWLADGSIYGPTTEAPTQVGRYTLSFEIEGEDAGRYSIAFYGDFRITPRSLTIVGPDVQVGLDDPLPELSELTCKIEGLAEGDQLDIKPQLRYATGENGIISQDGCAITVGITDVGNNYTVAAYKKGQLTLDNSDENVVERGFINKISWKVEKDGKLTLSGSGNYQLLKYPYELPWARREDVTSAVVQVSNITSMNHMFYMCSKLTDIDMSKVDISHVTDMGSMFAECSSLENISFGANRNTEYLENMAGMFSGCTRLSNVDLSGLDTRCVTNMGRMFSRCSALKNIDLTSFDTGNVTNMASMFYQCLNLKELDLSNFNTAKVTDMKNIFTNCRKLEKLDVSSFDTSQITDMSEMFASCQSLKSLDLSNFDTSKVTTMQDMFYACEDLCELNLSHFDTRQVTDMDGMFSLYTATSMGLHKLDLSSFDMSKVTSARNMFFNREGLFHIRTPKNCSQRISIPIAKDTDKWYQDTDTVWTELPTGLDYSIDLYKNDPSVGSEPRQIMYFYGVDVYDKTYDGNPIMYTGRGYARDLVGSTNYSLTPVGFYTGTLADGSTYIKTEEAPFQAGDYTLTFELTGEAAEKYVLKDASIEFHITQKSVLITAPQIIVKTGEQLPELSKYTCSVEGLLLNDVLLAGPQLKYSVENIMTSSESSYDIIPYGADAGNNYKIEYVNGKLLIEDSGKDPENPGENPDEPGSDSPFDDTDRIDLTLAGGVIAGIKTKIYDGMPYEPAVQVSVKENGKKKTLIEGADYEIKYQDNINAGTGSVSVCGVGIYKGKLTGSFTINPKPVRKLKIIAGSMAVGAPDTEFPVYVYDGSRLLAENMDYTLSDFAGLTARPAKSAKITINGIGNYTGKTVVKTAVYDTVASQTLSPENVVLPHTQMPYTGKAIKDNEPTVTAGGAVLTKNKDYKVQFQNNKNAGTAFVVVTGKGAYTGKVVTSFEITADRPTLTIADIKAKTYNGKLQKPSVKVKAGSKTLKKNKDYVISYKNNLHTGTATVTVTGRGNYSGTAEQAFTIQPQKIAKISVKGTQSEGLVITYNKRKLKEGKDYTLEYGETNKNKITVMIKAVDGGDFTGSVTKKVKIS